MGFHKKHNPIRLDKLTLPCLACRPLCVACCAVLQWVSDTFSDTLVGFANSIKTIDGGSHLEGLKAALTRLVNAAAKRAKVRWCFENRWT